MPRQQTTWMLIALIANANLDYLLDFWLMISIVAQCRRHILTTSSMLRRCFIQQPWQHRTTITLWHHITTTFKKNDYIGIWGVSNTGLHLVIKTDVDLCFYFRLALTTLSQQYHSNFYVDRKFTFKFYSTCICFQQPSSSSLLWLLS